MPLVKAVAAAEDISHLHQAEPLLANAAHGCAVGNMAPQLLQHNMLSLHAISQL